MDNIIQIDAIRIERHKPRKCVCKDRKYTIDSVNREITCECGIVHDPFEAMLDIAKYYERINEQHQRLAQQAQQWIKEKPHSVLFKSLERSYQRGTMLPFCPKCEQLFDFKEVTSFGNARFYKSRGDK